MFKLRSSFLLSVLFALFGLTAVADEKQLEQDLVRLYFGLGATASADSFECLEPERKLQLDEQLEKMLQRSDAAQLNVRVILRKGLRLTEQYSDSLTCVAMNDFADRLQLIEMESDPEYSDYLSFSFGRELLLEMIRNASIEAKMMNNFAYGDADLLSGDTNELLYELARDQIEFALVLLNDYDVGIDTKYFYKYLLERSEELEANIATEDKVFVAVRPAVGAIYRKMGMVLLGVDANEEGTGKYLEALIDYAEDTRWRIQSINNTILNSLPPAI